MRGEDRTTGALFSYVDVEARIPAKHPLRAMRGMTDAALAELDRAFSALYEACGRPSIRRSDCCARRCCNCSIRSARSGSWSNGWSSTFCFAGSSGLRSTRGSSTRRPSPRTATAYSHTGHATVSVFASRPARGEGAFERGAFFGRRNAVEGLGVDEELRPKDGSGEPPPPGRNGEADFRRTKRSNETHASTTDKDARLYRKGDGQESRLGYLGHALMENRNGLVVAAEATWRRERPNARRRRA